MHKSLNERFEFLARHATLPGGDLAEIAPLLMIETKDF
jgi:hypothetical protein